MATANTPLSFKGLDFTQGVPADMWSQLSGIYTNPQALQALRDQNGGGSEYFDPESGFSFVPSFKESDFNQVFSGGTFYNRANPDKGLGGGGYSTQGFNFDAAGKFQQPFQINKQPDSFMDRWGPLIPFLAAGGAAAFGLGGAAAAGAEIGAGAIPASGAAFSAPTAAEMAFMTGGELAGAGGGLTAGGGFTGTGLTLGGGGTGLSLGGGTLGMTAASPGASAIGSGLGVSEFAAGSGSLLSPAVLESAGHLTPSFAGTGGEEGVSDLGMSGADADVAFQGPGLGGGASVAGPGFAEQLMGLLQTGGLSSSAVKAAISSPLSLLGITNPAGALKMGASVAQVLAGLEGRKRAKQIADQMRLAGEGGGLPPNIGVGLSPEQLRLPDPGDITKVPGYQAGLEAVRRSMASQGYQGSGNMMAALSKYGGDFYDKYVAQLQNLNTQTLASNQQGINLDLARNKQRLDAAIAQAGPTYGGISSLALLSQGVGGFLERFL